MFLAAKLVSGNRGELKERAIKAKNASLSTMQNTRDRMSSKPISQTGYTPDWKRKQEMQEDPQRASYEASSSTSTPHSGPPPLPVRRNTRPGQSQVQYQEEGEEEPEIDWTNLTYEDKQVFFSWLDEFFARGSTTQNNNTPARPTAPPISSRSSLSSSSMNTPPPPTRGPPPVVNARTRPVM